MSSPFSLLGTCGRYTIEGPGISYLCEVRPSNDDVYDLYEILPVGVHEIGDFRSVEDAMRWLEDHEYDEDEPEQQPFDGSELEPSTRRQL